MNVKKREIIHAAETLFLTKGYSNTSIQDILDETKISKGTFYHYFSSKKDLVPLIYENFASQIRDERDNILVGEDKKDLAIFCKQLEVFFSMRSKKNLHKLYGELSSNQEVDIKTLVRKYRLDTVKWIELRLVDFFGEDKREYLFDNALFLHGVLFHLVHFCSEQPEVELKIEEIIQYQVSRLPHMIAASEALGQRLIDSQIFESDKNDHSIESEKIEDTVYKLIDMLLKKSSKLGDMNTKASLNFIKLELANEKNPRIGLMENVVLGMMQTSALKNEAELLELNNIFRKINRLA